jgi:hypothetical protein
MAPQRLARDRRAVALRGSAARLPDGIAVDVRGDATARVIRGVAVRADPSVGYGVWQKGQTRRLLLSLSHFGHSIASKNRSLARRWQRAAIAKSRGWARMGSEMVRDSECPNHVGSNSRLDGGRT